MKLVFNRVKKLLRDKSGVTLLETLVALTLLVIMIFCFMPLFARYMNGIKTAGRIKQETQYKVSIMERLVSYVYLGQGDNSYYQSDVDNVPVELSYGASKISFNSDESNRITGSFLSSNIQNGGSDNYVTLHTDSASAHMVCFPSELTDDFISTEFVVVPKGKAFAFADRAENKYASDDGEHFKVFYTNSGGGIQAVDPIYYDIKYVPDGEKNVAVFTFYGGNNVICFENSPIVIKYGSGNTDNLRYSATVEIGAPEIIMVGEKAENGKYYYYSTAGVDKDGKMDIIAKEMTSSPLTSAMNDVAWVGKGMGDDGNGGVNKYGYYVMGGDAGQVRRFWRNNETGNYYWGGDNLYNYDYYLNESGDANYQSKENFSKGYTTQAQFKSIFRGKDDMGFVKQAHNAFFDSDKITIGYKYQAVTMNCFTANVTEADNYYMTASGVFKKKSLVGTKYEYYGFHADMKEKEYKDITGWIRPGVEKGSKLNIDGYKEAMNYEYPSDTSLITITSVGAVQINTDNDFYYQSYANSHVITDRNVYPTESYTLYCGYIPYVTDIYGWKTSNLGGWSRYVHVATLGVALDTRDLDAFDDGSASWYPTGKYGDIFTVSKTLNPLIFPNRSYRALLNYHDDSDGSRDTVYPYPGNNKTHYYLPGTVVNGKSVAGQALTGQGMDYYTSASQEIDITTGYLSHPYALTTDRPAVTTIEGMTGSDWYFGSFDGQGTFDSTFNSSGLHSNITMLDVKSFYDDLNGNNITFTAGYSLGFIFNDYSWATRMGQVFNNGLVYIRATGDGTENDNPGDMTSGKGWTMAKESNVLHQFYGIDQYLGNNDGRNDGTLACYGWDTDDHRAYFNISDKDDRAPQAGHTPNPNEGSEKYGTNCHPLSQTKCTTVNKGVTWDEKTQIMWGTENGTILSWTYNYENKKQSKITAVTKEFESYMWADRLGRSSKDIRYFDYPSVSAGKSSNYGFVSVLSSIEDVAYADGYWVAVGSQSGKDPANYCSVNAYSASSGLLNGGAGSYINVKYDTGENNFYAWKTVKVAEEKNINFISVTYARGVWYAMGYIDENGNGKNELTEECVIYYSRDPAKQWSRAITSESGKNGLTYSKNTTALYFDTSNSKKPVVSTKLTGVNKMASRD